MWVNVAAAASQQWRGCARHCKNRKLWPLSCSLTPWCCISTPCQFCQSWKTWCMGNGSRLPDAWTERLCLEKSQMPLTPWSSMPHCKTYHGSQYHYQTCIQIYWVFICANGQLSTLFSRLIHNHTQRETETYTMYTPISWNSTCMVIKLLKVLVCYYIIICLYAIASKTGVKGLFFVLLQNVPKMAHHLLPMYPISL